MATTEKALRKCIVRTAQLCCSPDSAALLCGDISARFKDSLLITPSGGELCATSGRR